MQTPESVKKMNSEDTEVVSSPVPYKRLLRRRKIVDYRNLSVSNHKKLPKHLPTVQEIPSLENKIKPENKKTEHSEAKTKHNSKKKRKSTNGNQYSIEKIEDEKQYNSSSKNDIDDSSRTKMAKRRKVNPHNNFDRNKLYQSPSNKFEKQIPKIDDLLRDLKLQYKLKSIDKILQVESRVFMHGLKKGTGGVKKSVKHVRLVDCKHLTLTKLTKKFEKDLKFLDDIFYGNVYNKRHERFKNCPHEEQKLGNDLRCNEVTRVFSDEQLIHIVTLFRNRYDRGNRYTWSDYYFKVLLPEYCIKIFMDCYDMSYDNAIEYLNSLPVSINIT